MQGAKVLVVDDSTSVRKVLEKLLVGRGYQVSTAETAESGLEQVDLYNPELVIADVVMPGASGFEMCQQLKANQTTSNIPVILISGIINDGVVAQANQAGAFAVVSKPFTPDDLFPKIERALASKSETIVDVVSDEASVEESVAATPVIEEPKVYVDNTVIVNNTVVESKAPFETTDPSLDFSIPDIEIPQDAPFESLNSNVPTLEEIAPEEPVLGSEFTPVFDLDDLSNAPVETASAAFDTPALEDLSTSFDANQIPSAPFESALEEVFTPSFEPDFAPAAFVEPTYQPNYEPVFETPAMASDIVEQFEPVEPVSPAVEQEISAPAPVVAAVIETPKIIVDEARLRSQIHPFLEKSEIETALITHSSGQLLAWDGEVLPDPEGLSVYVRTLVSISGVLGAKFDLHDLQTLQLEFLGKTLIISKITDNTALTLWVRGTGGSGVVRYLILKQLPHLREALEGI